MKTNFILTLVGLSLTFAGASAATTVQNSTEIVRLENFRVEAPRQTEGERSLQQGLDELRATLRRPGAMPVKLELPLARALPAPTENQVAEQSVPRPRTQS